MIYVNFLYNISNINRNTHPTHNKQDIFVVAKLNDYVVHLQADLSFLVSTILPTVDGHKFNHLATNSTIFAAFSWPWYCMQNVAMQNRNKVQGAIELPVLEFFKYLQWFRFYQALKLVEKIYFSKNNLTLKLYKIQTTKDI